MSLLLPLGLASLSLFAPPEGPPTAPPADPQAGPAPAPVEAAHLPVDYVLPFDTEEMMLSDVLDVALEENLDLAQRVIDIEISEANVLSALGAFDVRITAGVGASLQESTPRGSAFVFSTGSRSITGYFGIARALETGGSISLRVDVSRTLTDQPISFFNPAAGSARLAAYNIQPTLQLTHPLLRGLGIEVNRAQLNRAKYAKSQAEAGVRSQANDLVRDLITAYWDLLFAQRDLENKRQSMELAREQQRRTRAQVSAGRLAAVDLKAVEQSLASRESEVLIAENTLLDRSLTLRTQIGQEFADRGTLGVTATTDPELVQVEPVDIDAEIERALRANPQVRQLELALSSKRIDELEAANQRLPQLDFTGTFSPQGRSVDTAPDAQSGDPGEQGSWAEAFQNFVNEDVSANGIWSEWTLSGNLDLTWDVQNRSAKGNHARVVAEVRQAELNLKAIRQTIASSVVRSASSLRTAGKRMEVAAISVELAEDNLEAEQARFAVGRSTNYDVLTRIDELSSARAEALNAQIEYLKAKVQLQALNGDILPAFGLETAIAAPVQP